MYPSCGTVLLNTSRSPPLTKHNHQIAYRPNLSVQFSNTFDVYLSILNTVDTRVRAVLKEDTPNWRMLNVCPPCLYVLEGEEELEFSIMTSVDGNQSLKLVDHAYRSGTPRRDHRQPNSELWISPQEVDEFQDDMSQG